MQKIRKQRMLTAATLLVLVTLITCYGLVNIEAASATTKGNQAAGSRSGSSSSVDGSIGELEPEQPSATRANQDNDRFGARGLLVAKNQQPVAQAQSELRNITAQNGQSIVLPCTLEPAADLSVSWIRGTSDLQLLTHDTLTIIQDDRFRVRAGPDSQHQWSLQIKNLDKTSDAGIYQCQLNSDPPQSQYFQLNIVEPQVIIVGAPDYTVKLGAALNLSCVISQSPDQFPFVFWHKDGRVINYELAQTERGRVVISKVSQRQHTTVSNMIINKARPSDSGNYTCRLSGAPPASIQVHVLQDSGSPPSTSAGSSSMMAAFQNDYQPASGDSAHHHSSRLANQQAAHSSSSGVRPQVIKISSKRLLALSLVFFIVQTWLQVVMQTQTAVSLCLLAIIGWFIGKLTEKPLDQMSSSSSDSKSPAPNEAKFSKLMSPQDKLDKNNFEMISQSNTLTSGHKDYSALMSEYEMYSKPPRSRLLSCEDKEALIYGNLSPQSRLISSLIGGDDATTTTNNSLLTQPSSPLLVDEALLRRANSALNLLRSLADVAQQHQDSGSLERQQRTPGGASSSSSSSSSNQGECGQTRAQMTSAGSKDGDQSSGHHSLDISDERHTAEEPSRLLECVTSNKQQELEGSPDSAQFTSNSPGDIIELASDQPTALSLLMDRLTLAADNEPAEEEPHYLAPGRSYNNVNRNNHNCEHNDDSNKQAY